MEALDVVSSRENALDREAAFGSGDDAVDSSIGADVGPLDFIYASGLGVATVDDVGFPVVERLVDGFQVVVHCGPPWGIRSGCLPDISIIAHVVWYYKLMSVFLNTAKEGLFCVFGGHSFGYALRSSSVTSTT